VLGTFDWQLIDSVVVQHLSYAAKGLAELAEDKPAVRIGYDLHVHETRHTPAHSTNNTVINSHNSDVVRWQQLASMVLTRQNTPKVKKY